MALSKRGFTIPRLDEIIDSIAQRQERVFPDLNTSLSTPDGQLNGLLAEAIQTAFETTLNVYNGLDPKTAEGVMLDRVCALTGIKRKPGFPSRVNMSLMGVPETIVPAGTMFADTQLPPHRYKLEETQVLDQYGNGAGFASGLYNKSDYSNQDEITVVVTPVNGLGNVTNPSPTAVGAENESDYDLRIRRHKSSALPGTALVDSVFAEIMSKVGVIDARVYENAENIPDPDGIPGHALYCVILGGDEDEIGEAIMTSKSIGCTLHGTDLVSWFDIQGNAYTVHYQRPFDVPIFLEIGVTTDEFDESIIVDVKNRISAYVEAVKGGQSTCAVGSFLISDDVYASSFYFAFEDVEYTVVDIMVGIADPADQSRVVIALDQLSSFSEDNINVVEVV